jgi:hypothetical protein
MKINEWLEIMNKLIEEKTLMRRWESSYTQKNERNSWVISSTAYWTVGWMSLDQLAGSTLFFGNGEFIAKGSGATFSFSVIIFIDSKKKSVKLYIPKRKDCLLAAFSIL